MTERILTLAARSFYEALQLYFEPLFRLWRWWESRQLLSSAARKLSDRLGQTIYLLENTKIETTGWAASRLQEVSQKQSQAIREEIRGLGERLAKIESLLQARNLAPYSATPSHTIQPGQFVDRFAEVENFASSIKRAIYESGESLETVFVGALRRWSISVSSLQQEQLQATYKLGERLESVAGLLQANPLSSLQREQLQAIYKFGERLEALARYRSTILVSDGFEALDEERAFSREIFHAIRRRALESKVIVSSRASYEEADEVRHAVIAARERVGALWQLAFKSSSVIAGSHERLPALPLKYGEGRRLMLQASLDEHLRDLPEFAGQRSRTADQALDRFLTYLEIADFLTNEGLNEAAAAVMTRAVKLSGIISASRRGTGRRP